MAIPAKVLEDGNRQGTHISSSIVLPADVGVVTVRLDIAAGDYTDPDNFVRFASQRSEDGGLTWLPFVAATWNGGPYTDENNVVNPPPTFTVNCAEFAGQRVRIEVDIAKRMRVGVTVTA
jgi:hypothetical protein